jgi:DnaJ-related protein SCJ1
MQVFQEESNEMPEADPGDIVFTVNTANHPIFERRGNDLYTKLTISLVEALTGFTKSINHLDEVPVSFRRSGVTQYGLVDTIIGAGMPLLDNPEEFGDLYVEYVVQFPEQVDLKFVEGS